MYILNNRKTKSYKTKAWIKNWDTTYIFLNNFTYVSMGYRVDYPHLV